MLSPAVFPNICVMSPTMSVKSEFDMCDSQKTVRYMNKAKGIPDRIENTLIARDEASSPHQRVLEGVISKPIEL